MGEIHRTISTGEIDAVAVAARMLPPVLERDYGEPLARSHGMDGIREMLSAVRDAGVLSGNFRALLHIAIGRKVTRPDGSTLSTGVTWRALAAELKNLRFDQDLVREYGADPDALTARERERFWYSAIAVSKVDSAEAIAEADKFTPKLKALGYIVGPSPSAPPPTPAPKAKPAEAKPKESAKEKEKDDKAGKKKKKP